MDATFPTTQAEVQANRDKFTHALITEPRENQCRSSLFAGGEKNPLRCAVGLAAFVLLGLRSMEQVSNWELDHGMDVYVAVGKMLDIPLDELGKYSVDDIIDANDVVQESFEEIGRTLIHVWTPVE